MGTLDQQHSEALSFIEETCMGLKVKEFTDSLFQFRVTSCHKIPSAVSRPTQHPLCSEVDKASCQGNFKQTDLTIYTPLTEKSLGMICSLTVNDQLTFKNVHVLLTNLIMK